MTIRIEYDPHIRNMDDSISKVLPVGGLLAGAAKMTGIPAALGAAAGAAKKVMGIGQNKPDPALTAAEVLVQQKQGELSQAEKELQTLMGQAQQAPVEATPNEEEPMPALATASAGVEGMDSTESRSPVTQPGTDAPPPATPLPPVTKSYFKDNFGISGSELIDLLEKGGEDDVALSVEVLLRQEQQAVLKQFSWWQENDTDLLHLKDNDYNLLTSYPDRLELPLRQTINAVKKGDLTAWNGWHTRLDAENRLSRRERSVLNKCYDTLRSNGDMNSQTLSTYGVKASPTEIASLIKSYGYLFDVNVVGRGTKHDDRCLYYGTPKPPIFLKTVDSFIGNLWEVDGSLSLTPMNAPRLILPFNSERGQDYTVVLKQLLGVENIMWEGRQFVIEGDYAVKKAATVALPFLSLRKEEGSVLLAALEGNHDAGKIIAYQNASPQDQVNMLKEWNVSEGELQRLAGVISNG